MPCPWLPQYPALLCPHAVARQVSVSCAPVMMAPVPPCSACNPCCCFLCPRAVARLASRILCRHPFSESKRAIVIPQSVERLYRCYWDGTNAGRAHTF